MRQAASRGAPAFSEPRDKRSEFYGAT
jgi:hypothetical protein